MRDQTNGTRSSLRVILSFLIIFVMPLALGLYFAPKWLPTPKVGVIRLNYEIDGFSAALIGEQLAYAREHNDIKAVILVLNSPGGSAAYSEELFMDIWHTRQTLPVVASVDLLAASGAYYMAAAADEIYAKPTSAVGSIGVIAFQPDPAILEEELLTTGPYKGSGGTQDGFMRQIEMAKFSFLNAVQTGRGSRLTIGQEVLSRAEIWTGVQAQDFGLVDGLMATEEAVARSAQLAGLSNYEIVELYPLAFPDAEDIATYRPDPIDPARLWQAPVGLPAGVYYRYIPLPEIH